MGDFYLDINTSGSDKSRLKLFCDVFNIANLISSKTCFMKSRKRIILTITLLSFQKTHKTLNSVEWISNWFQHFSKLVPLEWDQKLNNTGTTINSMKKTFLGTYKV